MALQFVAGEREEIVAREIGLGRFGEIFLRVRHGVGAFEGVRLAVAEPPLDPLV